MSLVTIKYPHQSEILKFGLLAYLAPDERKAFYDLPRLAARQLLAQLEREVREIKRNEK